MARELTKKQKGFVRDYVKTGIGEVAAKKNYDAKNGDTARSIASENLTKPYIIEAVKELEKKMSDRIPDDLLEQRHLELLNKREKKITEDGEEIDVGPDVQAVTKSLDMAYKLKGSYAAEKHQSTNLNVNIEAGNEELDALRAKYEEELKAKYANVEK